MLRECVDEDWQERENYIIHSHHHVVEQDLACEKTLTTEQAVNKDQDQILVNAVLNELAVSQMGVVAVHEEQPAEILKLRQREVGRVRRMQALVARNPHPNVR